MGRGKSQKSLRIIAAAYHNCVLLELDRDEQPVRAYQREEAR